MVRSKIKLIPALVAALVVASGSSFAEPAKPRPADNSVHNKVQNQGMTADDQPISGRAEDITAKIREAVTERDDFSIYAKNIKILTDTNGNHGCTRRYGYPRIQCKTI